MAAFELLLRVLLAGFAVILALISLQSFRRYREARFITLTLAFGLPAAAGALLTYDALTPGDILLTLDALVALNLAQLVLLYLAIVRRR
jgi:hypothetical protein